VSDKAPPLSQERLSVRPDGLLELTLKKTWKDGTRARVLTTYWCGFALQCPHRRCTCSVFRCALAAQKREPAASSAAKTLAGKMRIPSSVMRFFVSRETTSRLPILG
jgi:hypothetical protein